MSAPFPEGINFLPLVQISISLEVLTRLRNEVRNLLSTHTLTGLHACIHEDKWTRLYYGACEVNGKQTRFNFIKKFNFFNPRTEPYQSQTCLRFYCNFRCLENFQHVSASSGGWKAVKRARAMNEMQEYRVLFTPACVQHFCRTLWGEYNNCTILLRHLWSSLVPSILCFAYKKRLPASVNTRIYKTSIFIRKTCAKQFSWFNVYFCRSRLSFGMENSSII